MTLLRRLLDLAVNAIAHDLAINITAMNQESAQSNHIPRTVYLRLFRNSIVTLSMVLEIDNEQAYISIAG